MLKHTTLSGVCGAGAVFALLLCQSAVAVPIRAYVTGDDLSLMPGDVIFQVDADTSIAGSAVFTVLAQDSERIDGISFIPGVSTNFVATGNTAGSVARYNLATGAPLTARVLPDFDSSPRPGPLFTTDSHIYYIGNQFGIAPGPHQILRTPIAGPAGTTDVVFDGAAMGAGGATNLEGINIRGDRIYFFGRSDGSPGSRELMSIGVTGAGIWNGVAPTVHITGLSEVPSGSAGADELEFDPQTGYLFGSNNATGEVIALDLDTGLPVVPPGGVFPFFISPSDIAADMNANGMGPELLGAHLPMAPGAGPDGLRTDGHGGLLWVTIAGVIGVIDINGVLVDGVDDTDLIGLYNSPFGLRRFDDIASGNPGSGNFGTPGGVGGGFGLLNTPEPSSWLCLVCGAAALALYRLRRR